MPHPSAERHDPAVPFHCHHESDAHLPRRLRRDDHADVTAEIARQTLVDSRRVADADLHLFDIGPSVAEALEPLGRLRCAAAGIDDEIGPEARLRFAQLLCANAANDAILDEECHHARAVQDADVWQLQHAATDRALEERATEQQAIKPALKLRFVVPVLEPAEVADDVAGYGAGVEQVALEPWEQRHQSAQAARQQSVAMMTLRDCAAVGDAGRQGVTIQDRDAIEVRAEHPRGQKPADARADDDGMVAVETTGGRTGRDDRGLAGLHFRLLLGGQVRSLTADRSKLRWTAPESHERGVRKWLA